MIRSCENIETLKEFRKFSIRLGQTRSMGLKETARMMRWSYHCLIRPTRFDVLMVENRRKS